MRSTLALFIFFICLIATGCGVPGPSGGSSQRNEQTLFETAESIKVRVTPNLGMTVTNLSIITLDENFQDDIQTSPPEFQVDKTGTNAFTIRFSSLYEERINTFARATVGTGEVFYAPLFSQANANDFMEINILSHYVVKKFFDAITTREELNNMLPCIGEGECENQPEVKSQQLVNLYELVLDYETELPLALSVADSIEVLDTFLDLRTQVELGVNEIVRTISPIAQGTKRAFNITDGTLLTEATRAKRYNSTFFGLSLNRENPDTTDDATLLSTHLSYIIGAGELGGGLPAIPVYPQLLQTTTRFDLRRDILVSDVPFEKRSLRINAEDDYEVAAPVPINTLGSPIFDGFLSTQGNLLHGRKLEQTIPGTSTDPKNIGWQFNPIFSRLYRVNDVEIAIDPANPPQTDIEEKIDPNWLVTSNISSGDSFLLDSSNSRVRRSEAMQLFSWEVYSRETETDFELDELNGKTFGVVGFSVRLREDDQAFEVFADLMQWQKSGNQIQESQPDDTLDHFRSFAMQRDVLGISSAISTTQNIFPVRPIAQRATVRESDDDTTIIESTQRGLLVLDGGQNPSIGNSTNDGRNLSFALDSDDRGEGILLALEMRTLPPIFNDERYQLQGNSVTLTDSGNFFRNYNFSSLQIDDGAVGADCDAILDFQVIELTHDVANNEVQALQDESESALIASDDCSIENSKIELVFNDVQSKTLTLKGFMAREGLEDEADQDPGKLINFIMIHGSDTLGLLFANLEQDLSPTFVDEFEPATPDP